MQLFTIRMQQRDAGPLLPHVWFRNQTDKYSCTQHRYTPSIVMRTTNWIWSAGSTAFILTDQYKNR